MRLEIKGGIRKTFPTRPTPGAIEKPRYLSILAARLAAGLKSLPDSFRSRHTEYLLATQRPDGGFAGRLGGSDIYYTMFALRAAELLVPAGEGLWRAAAQYARSLPSSPRDMIECLCLLHIRRLVGKRAGAGRSDERRAEVMEVVERSRAPDGGYARFPGGEATVYHTFLAALCAELSDSDFPGAAEAAAFVHSRRRADGGYADSATDRGEGATNSTAAALALLTLFGAAQAPRLCERAAEFLASMQRPEGGFAASAGAPGAGPAFHLHRLRRAGRNRRARPGQTRARREIRAQPPGESRRIPRLRRRPRAGCGVRLLRSRRARPPRKGGSRLTDIAEIDVLK